MQQTGKICDIIVRRGTRIEFTNLGSMRHHLYVLNIWNGKERLVMTMYNEDHAGHIYGVDRFALNIGNRIRDVTVLYYCGFACAITGPDIDYSTDAETHGALTIGAAAGLQVCLPRGVISQTHILTPATASILRNIDSCHAEIERATDIPVMHRDKSPKQDTPAATDFTAKIPELDANDESGVHGVVQALADHVEAQMQSVGEPRVAVTEYGGLCLSFPSATLILRPPNITGPFIYALLIYSESRKSLTWENASAEVNDICTRLLQAHAT